MSILPPRLGSLTIRHAGDFMCCTRCRRGVDLVAFERPSQILSDWRGILYVPTGEFKIMIQCHGEEWVYSEIGDSMELLGTVSSG